MSRRRDISDRIGREKRRATAKRVAAEIAEQFESKPNEPECSVLLPNHELRDFRRLPFGSSLNGKIRKLEARIRNELKRMGYASLVGIRHTGSSKKPDYLKVTAHHIKHEGTAF